MTVFRREQFMQQVNAADQVINIAYLKLNWLNQSQNWCNERQLLEWPKWPN